MTHDEVLKTISTNLGVPYEIVKDSIQAYNEVKMEFLTNLEVSEVSMYYLGTYVIDKNKFFRQLFEEFGFLKAIRYKKKLIAEINPNDKELEELDKIYERVASRFATLWKVKQRENWRCVKTKNTEEGMIRFHKRLEVIRKKIQGEEL